LGLNQSFKKLAKIIFPKHEKFKWEHNIPKQLCLGLMRLLIGCCDL
jgi:hypothetical protein